MKSWDIPQLGFLECTPPVGGAHPQAGYAEQRNDGYDLLRAAEGARRHDRARHLRRQRQRRHRLTHRVRQPVMTYDRFLSILPMTTEI